MAKREYQGPAIDGTMKYISEANNGKTVGGTTEDDWFGESTDWLPDDIDESDITPKQKKAILAYLSQPNKENISIDELAEGREFSRRLLIDLIHATDMEVPDGE